MRNPESFYHDVNSVAGLLKQFFRELPDPLLTAEHYNGFIEASSKSLTSRLNYKTHASQSTMMISFVVIPYML